MLCMVAKFLSLIIFSHETLRNKRLVNSKCSLILANFKLTMSHCRGGAAAITTLIIMIIIIIFCHSECEEFC
jgi:hypothetical protein